MNRSSVMSERSTASETSGQDRGHVELEAPIEEDEGAPAGDGWERDALAQIRLAGGSTGRY